MTGRPALAVAALAIAVIAAVAAMLASALTTLLLGSAGVAYGFASLSLLIAIVLLPVDLLALVLGLVSLGRPAGRTLGAAAVGISSYVLLGQLAGLVGALAGMLIRFTG